MTIHYFSSAINNPYFFSQELKNVINNLANVLPERSTINVFPDAVVKNNGMPNGMAIIMPYAETILFPFLLRDPGCGFLIFTLNTPRLTDGAWGYRVGERLHALINTEFRSGKIQAYFLENISVRDILLNGLMAISHLLEDPSCFLHKKFEVDPCVISLTDCEEEALLKDLMTLTNTVEIRKVADSLEDGFPKNSLVGFIHSGCNIFPKILAERFVYDIAAYADLNGLATLDQIKKGQFGVPIRTDLGYKYLQWQKCAMNYALVSRALIYLSIKKCLSDTFDVHTTLLNDVTHAGIFEQEDNEPYTVSTRGVQPLFSQNARHQSLRLIAGQAEGVALLVKASNTAIGAQMWIQHGTGYNIPSAERVATFFKPDERVKYINAAKTSYCNATMNLNLTLPYSFNTLAAQEDQKNSGLIEPLVVLTPFINVHGQMLIDEKHGDNYATV